jgi:hypothetical protein
MDPQSLIDTASAGVLAPLWFYWFVEFFKWLGFTLHTVPMNLWYAGLIVALGLHLRGGQHARRFATRLLQQMPVIVALGVNFGIVPLLFMQLAYHKVFYPATILMAWFWLAIIGLLIPAYYGVYAYAWGIRNGGIARWRIIAGWCAAAMFIVIGFIFTNGLSLMDHVDRWPVLWQNHSMAGAALGTALNVGDPTFLPRWLMMFCLALGTTAVWLLVDAFLLTGDSADEAYRQWALRFARHLYTFGMVWASATGAWYVFLGWTSELRGTMFGWPLLPLTLATAVAPGLPWLLMMTAGWWKQKRLLVAAIALAQFGVLGINAASRQIVQNVNLQPFLDVSAQLSDVEFGPLAMFLIVFVIGLGIVGWMLVQISRSRLPDGTS